MADRQDLGTTARRSLAEFAVIVVGVLVALGVDDWRQAGEERVIEREAYVQLMEDLRLDSLDLDVARLKAGNRVASGLLLLERHSFPASELAALRDRLASALAFSDLSQGTEGADSIGTELATLYSTNLFDPNRSALTSLVASGELRLLRDTEVRSALVSYSSKVDAAGEVRGLTRDAQIRFRMYLDSHGISPFDLFLKTDLDEVLIADPRFSVEVQAVLFRALVQVQDLSSIEAPRRRLRGLVDARLR